MAGQVPNSQNISRVGVGAADSTTVAVHPEYYYWLNEWQKIRDVIAGQREIKRKGRVYLKGPPKMDSDDYETYLERATFYNMTRQTVNGMVGQAFSRDPLILGMPDDFKNAIRLKFGKDGSGHVVFAKTVFSEQVSMGRYGVLVDAPETASTTPTSFAVGYAAENILDWDIQDVGGEYQPTRILLREFKRQRSQPQAPQKPGAPNKRGMPVKRSDALSTARYTQPSGAFIESFTYATVYRDLVLEAQDAGPPVYKQYLYNESPTGTPVSESTPLLRGQPLNFIPFKFFGAQYNTADVEAPPVLDIVDLNLSHYRTYAELEWGRMYTALPVYYAPVSDGEGAGDYIVGPSVVWEVEPDQEPGILEYKGDGLKTLESALQTKEQQIAAIGGRMMPGHTAKGSASAEETERSAQSEQALILHALQACEAGMTDCIRWWLMWRDVALADSEDVEYSMNRIFGDARLDARAMRVFQQLHDEGKLPIEIIYNAVIATGFMDPETTLEEFIDSLNDPANFPNNPDVVARQQGFTSRQQQLDQRTVDREAGMQQQEIDLQEREVELMENAPPPLPPKTPNPAGAALPARAGGPVPPKPGRGGNKTSKPKPGAGG